MQQGPEKTKLSGKSAAEPVGSLAGDDLSCRLVEETHLGRWLVRNLSGLGEIELPSRRDARASPFEGSAEQNFADEATIAERVAALGTPRGERGAPSDEQRETGAKRLVVNGEPHDIAASNLAEALSALSYADSIVATALNGEFVPARKREATPVKDGDRIEIVAPRQGG